MPSYCECNGRHWNVLPDGFDLERIGTAYCGIDTCRLSLGRFVTDEAPDGARALPIARILGAPPQYYQCGAGHWAVADAALSTTERQNAVCGALSCGAPLTAKGTGRPTGGVAMYRVLLLPMSRLKSIDLRIRRSGTYDASDHAVELGAEHAFRDLCEVTRLKFKSGAKLTLTISGTACAEIAYPDFGTGSALHPYCYPLNLSTSLRLTTRVTYADLGKQLLFYTPDFLDMLLTVVTRVMKQSLQEHDLTSIGNVRRSPLILSPIGEALVRALAKWDPMALLAVLAGAAACETGRGVVGFANSHAAFRHIKHDSRMFWGHWGYASMDEHSVPDPHLQKMVESIQAVYPDTYDFTGEEPKRNAVGFKGSEALIKRASGQSVTLYDDSIAKRDAYDRFSRRDVGSFGRRNMRYHPYRRPKTPRAETPEQIFERKLVRHLELAFPRLT
jgi:hypothetical protein